jgi:8-oxo-dGTP diphosphatase
MQEKGMPIMIKATVGGLIIRNDDGIEKILLIQRSVEPFQDYWALPGGHIDSKETSRDAIKREVKEETGLTYDPHFFTYNDEIFEKQDFHAVVMFFVGNATGKIKIQKGEVFDYKWFTFPEALEKDLAFNHRDIILSYMRKCQNTSAEERTGIIEEFKALRQEMNTVFNTRIWGAATYLIITAGVLASMGEIFPPIGFILLIYTAIPFILHTASRERTRLRIASYIRIILEKQHPGLKWENSLKKWRDIFDNKGENKGIYSVLQHIFSLIGIHLIIPFFALIGLLYHGIFETTFLIRHWIIYLSISLTGLIICFLAFRSFCKIYSKGEDYDKMFAQLKTEIDMSKLSD